MPFVMPLTNFEHNGPKRSGVQFFTDDRTAKQLELKKLVTLDINKPAKKAVKKERKR